MRARVMPVLFAAIFGLVLFGCGEGPVTGTTPSTPSEEAVSPQLIGEEWPLVKADYYWSAKRQYRNEVQLYVVLDNPLMIDFKQAPIYNIAVVLRADSKDYTSVVFSGPKDRIGWRYASATILVPVFEDVAVWQNKLVEWRDAYEAKDSEEFLPRRVLP